MADVTERPLETQLRRTASGDERSRVFDVTAVSQDDALNRLESEKNVAVGSKYRDGLGQSDDNLFCRDFDVRPKTAALAGSTRLWEVRATYRPTSDRDRNNPEPVPGGRTVYIWGRGEQTIQMEKDLDDEPVVNSRDELYDPAPAIVVPHRTLQIKWFVASISMQTILAYDAAVNNDTWRIRGRWEIVPGQVLSHGINPEEHDDDLYLMVWDLEFRPGGALWHPIQLPDQAKEPDGTRILLDGSGDELTPGSEMVLNEFRGYELRQFSTWGV